MKFIVSVAGLLVLALALAAPDAQAQARAGGAPPAPQSEQVSGSVQPPPQALARRTMTALRIDDGDAVRLDGRLDEPFWQRAEPASGFIQQDPQNGAPASERTEVRIVYNHRSLYMGVHCFDSEPEKWLGFQRRRDEFLQSDDRFMWVIDPFLTSQNGYFFETNPSGLMGDGLLSPAGQNRQWDGIWNERVRHDDTGWTVEVEIPFSTLNFDPNSQAWGINFQRTVRRKNEDSVWTGWARNQGLQRLSNTGLIEGLNQNVSQGLGLEVRPYGLATSDSAPGGSDSANKNRGKAGLDLFYSLTPGLRANLTINTDFAQTEVDQRLTNFTQFSLFLPEKRTFFLEGANLFDFGAVPQSAGGFSRPSDTSLVPFFTRRIGLDANGNPQKIDYGAKLIGQIGRSDVGVLQVRTGTDPDLPGVPSEDFSVFRLKRRVLRQSYVGGMYTLRQAHSPGAPALQTVGTDVQLATNTFRGNKNLFVSAFFLRNTTPAHTGKGAAYSARTDYLNDRWNAGMSYRGVQQFFAPAIGFTTRTNYQQYNPYLNFSPRPRKSTYIRQLGFTVDMNLQTDMNNLLLSRIWNLTLLNVNLHSQDSVTFAVIPDYEFLDRDFNIATGPTTKVTLRKGNSYDFVRYRINARTADRRVVAINPTIEWGSFYSGTRQLVSTNVTLRARPGVIVYLSQEWNRVDLVEGKFETRLYRFTPELQFNQWISTVNTIQYDTVSAVFGWQSRFRWILKPGNDLFFVYTHNWLDDPTLNRFSTLSSRAALKVSYSRRF